MDEDEEGTITISIIGEDPKFIKQVSCSNCAAILSYTENDTTEKKERDYTGSVDLFRVLECQNCSYEIRLSR